MSRESVRKLLEQYPLLMTRKTAEKIGLDVDGSVARGEIVERKILMTSALAMSNDDFEGKMRFMIGRIERPVAESFLVYVSRLVKLAQKAFAETFQIEVDEELIRDLIRKALQEGRLRALPARTNDHNSIYQVVYSAVNEPKLRLLYEKCFEKLRQRGRVTPDDLYSVVRMNGGKWARLFESHLTCLGYATTLVGDLFSPKVLKSSN